MIKLARGCIGLSITIVSAALAWSSAARADHVFIDVNLDGTQVVGTLPDPIGVLGYRVF